MRHAVDIERGSLVGDAAQVVILVALDLERCSHLGHLPLAEPGERRRQQSRDFGTELRSDLCRAGQQKVARHDCHEVAPAGVDALHAAPAGRLVHDVVVIERGEVDKFDGNRSEQDVRRDIVTLEVRRGDGQRGPEALASRLDEVARHLVQERVLPEHRVAQAQLKPSEILLADREGERVQAAHQVRHLTPKEHRTDSRTPTPVFRRTVILPSQVFNSDLPFGPDGTAKGLGAAVRC